MARTIAAFVGGLLLGGLMMFAAGRLVPPSSPSPDEVVRDIADVPVMAQATADKHRVEQYVGITSIEELLSLPTEFARSSALYSLADRSGSAGVQNLIFEANRIADDVERAALLEILFFRLAELDPQSALVLARTADYSSIRSIERTVWRAWARKDLDDALFAAKTQTLLAHQNMAAQSLYRSFGYMGNETTQYIEDELGIGPDRSTRAGYLYRFADKSTADAIAFINSLERGVEQTEYVTWLAYYVSLRDPQAALANASLFKVASDGENFMAIINSDIARQNPQATIERLLVNGFNQRTYNELYAAIGALAATDINAVKQYYEQAQTADTRQMIGTAIASELAKTNPDDALAWARGNDSGQFPGMTLSVLFRIAEADPQRALTEAFGTPNAQVRSRLVSSVVQHIAQKDPSVAVAFLDQVPDGAQKLEASRHLSSAWMSVDPDAATEWILSQDEETAQQMIQGAAFRMVHRDIDAAMALLPRLDKSDQVNLRRQIVEQLATNRSPAEAQAFAQRFEGQPGYDQLQATVVAGVARSDVLMAKQLADQLAPGNARDGAYAQVISQQAQTDPVQAIAWLNSIGDEKARSSAAGRVVTQWYANDPPAAERWVMGQPPGALRDDAIVGMSSRWREPSAEQTRLIASISDPDKRGQAKIQQIYNVARTDPARARELLEDDDIPSHLRQQAEVMLGRFSSRY